MQKTTLWGLMTAFVAFGSTAQAQNLLPKPDFGTNASPATAPADFITGLTLDKDGNGASASSSYLVTGSPASLNKGFTVSDHTTGNSTGALLAVDGPTSTTQLVWQQTVTGLQPNTSYTFSYWQTNLVTTNPANLQLTYQGNTTPATVAGSFQTSGTTWAQTSYTITTGPSDTQLTLSLYDLVTTSGGNDFGLDDMSLVKTATTGIVGTVFEDVNYGGGEGRTLATANASAAASFPNGLGRLGAVVELYDATGAFVARTTTDINGLYRFPTAAAGATYTVRVVSSTVSSGRPGYVSGLLPVVTYQNGTTDQVGGPSPALPDAPANSTSATLSALTTSAQAAEAVASVTVPSTGNATGVDFGFNFDVVVNTKTSGQGSLSQFIANSNALGGEANLAQAGSYINQVGGTTTAQLPAGVETSIFMIPDGQAHAGLRASANNGPASQLSSNGVAIINSPSLPAVTGPATVINGWTQSFNIGNTNNKTLGTGGTVGVTSTALPQINGPEVQLTGTTATAVGLNLAGNNDGALGLAILDFGNAVDSDANAQIRVAANSVTLQGNIIGANADGSRPGTASNADGVRATAGSSLNVQNNVFLYLNGLGIFTKAGVTGATISQNEVRSNNLKSGTALAAIALEGSSTTVSNNLITGNAGAGIDSKDPGTAATATGSTGGLVVSGNTVTGNGIGWTGAAPVNQSGIRLYGTGNTVSQNIVSSNYGAGVFVTSAAQKVAISQNVINNNGDVKSANNAAATGQLGIDLATTTDADPNTGTAPFVTLNNSAGTSGANALINFPVISSAVLASTSNGMTLTVKGTAPSDATIELFLAKVNSASAAANGVQSNEYGQGYSYLYSGPASGTSFSFTIPLSSLTADQQTAITTIGARLTSTATTTALGTSEFSQNSAFTSQPSAFNVTNLRLATNAAAAPLSPGLTSPQAASDPIFNIASYTVYAPTGGTLTYNGTAITGSNSVVIPANSTGQLLYTPPATVGTYTFKFFATNTNGNTTNTATYSIPVVQTNTFTANDDGLDAPANTTTAGNVVLNDGNTDKITNFTATLITSPTHGSVSLKADGSYTYTPAQDYTGADSFTYQICTTDGGCSNTATVAINVYDPNRVCNSATGPNLLLNPGFENGNDGSFTSAYKFVPRPANGGGLYPEVTYAVDEDAHYYHNNFTGKGRGGSGKFMIINGAADQSQVYTQTISVTPKRYYTFSGYAQSVNPVSPAILGFVINDKSASVATTLTSNPEYQKFSGVWYSGNNNTAKFEVRDINRAANGNDFGLDDLYFGTCSIDLTALDITNSPTMLSQANPTKILPLAATLSNNGSTVTIASFVIQSLPTFGELRLGGPTGQVVVAGQVIPYAQRSELYFAPKGTSGTATFTYTAVDSEGAGSNNIATYSIPVSAPLPVQLTDFTVRSAGQAAQLAWTTASEQHNDHFDIERSTTGQANSFVAIGQVHGQGSKATATTYQYLDRNAAAVGQQVYYRLRQVDTDGTTAYSPVRAVSFGLGIASATVYPNPTNGLGTTLDLSTLPATELYQVRLLDATGRQVGQWQLAGGQLQALPLGQLASGTYLLQLTGKQVNGSVLRQVLHLTKE